MLRLLPADQRPVAQRRAAKRTAEARVAEQEVSTFAVIPAGRGGFARPVPGGITSPFGMRFHPVLHVWKLHDGTDFGAALRHPDPGARDAGGWRACRTTPATGTG